MPLSPRVVLTVAHSVTQRLSPFVRSIDFALDWEMIESGHALYQYVQLNSKLNLFVLHDVGYEEGQAILY